MKKTSNVIFGLILVFIGIIFGLNALGITNIDVFFDGWWTLFIIVPSIIGLINDQDKTGSIIGLIIGFGFLLSCYDLIDFKMIWKLIIPIIIVLIGLKLIFGDLKSKKINKEVKKIKKNNNMKNCSAIFSEQRVDCSDEQFTGSALTSIFGSLKYDLTNAKIDEDVIINVSCVFASIDIYVPSDINVKISSTTIFGETKDNRNNIINDKNNTIYIYSNCLFGEINIK